MATNGYGNSYSKNIELFNANNTSKNSSERSFLYCSRFVFFLYDNKKKY